MVTPTTPNLNPPELKISNVYVEPRVSHRELARFLGRTPDYVARMIVRLSKVLGFREAFRDIPETKERTSTIQGRYTIHRWLDRCQALKVARRATESLSSGEWTLLTNKIEYAFSRAEKQEEPANGPREVLEARLSLQMDTIIRLNRRITELTGEVERLKHAVQAARTAVVGEAHKPVAALGVPMTGRFAKPAFFSYRLWHGWVPSRHVHGLKMLAEVGAADDAGNPTAAGAPYARRVQGDWAYDQSLVTLCKEVAKETAQIKRAA